MRFKIFTLLLLFFTLADIYSQVRFVNDIIVVNGKSNEEPHIYPEVKNEGSSEASFYWKLTKPEFNSAWQSQVCDLNNICFPWNVDKSTKVNKLPGFGTNKMSFQLKPNNVVDTGIVIMNIYSDVAYTNLLDSVSIFLNISLPPNSSKILNSDREISIYPNPATSYFQLNGNPNIGKIEVFNMIGKKIKTFEKSQTSYNVRDLRNGMYLLRLHDAKGQVMKVIRLKIDHDNP
jgi:hypothetical protein